MLGQRWVDRNSRAIPPELEALSYPREILEVLVARGVTTPQGVEAFLDTGLHRLSDPFELRGMREAVDRIVRAIESREHVCIYGDYDVDGQTSTALLLRVLRSFGARVQAYIPHRQQEGYGLNVAALERLKGEGCTLVVSVDCGISACDEARWAAANGLDLVITDHHEPPAALPQTVALVNPKLDAHAALHDLAGCGVTFKLAEALGIALGKGREVAHEYIDLVALGTVADVVPLLHENRALVRAGLERINSDAALVGIRALCDVAGVSRPVRAGHIGFSIAPRLNAAGRIGDAAAGLALLTADSYEEARPIAEFLNLQNAERQEIEAAVVEEARQMIEAQRMSDQHSIVVCGNDWHIGVVGIAASRLVEAHYRPTVVLTVEEGRARGSGRSIPGFDLYSALSECSDLFEAFGGHTQAAGITLPLENVHRFQKRFNEVAAERLKEEDLVPRLEFDGEVPLERITLEWIERLALLEPYGLGNPTPVFACRNVALSGSAVGRQREHLKCRVCAPETTRVGVDGIGFGMAAAVLDRLRESELYDVAFTPEVNEWNGRRRPSLRVKDISLSALESRPQAALLAAARPLWERERAGELSVLNTAWSGRAADPLIVDSRGADKPALLAQLVKAGESALVQTNRQSVWQLANELAQSSAALKRAVFPWHSGLLESHAETLSRAVSEPGWIVVAAEPLLAAGEHDARARDEVWALSGEGTERLHVAIILWEPVCDPRSVLAQIEALTRLGASPSLHLAYGTDDVRRFAAAIAGDLPNLEQLRRAYAAIREILGESKGGRLSSAALVSHLMQRRPQLLSEYGFARAVAIFTELRLLVLDQEGVKLRETRGEKVDLTWSVLYNECNFVRTDVWGDLESLASLPPDSFYKRLVASAQLIEERTQEMNVS